MWKIGKREQTRKTELPFMLSFLGSEVVRIHETSSNALDFNSRLRKSLCLFMYKYQFETEETKSNQN